MQAAAAAPRNMPPCKAGCQYCLRGEGCQLPSCRNGGARACPGGSRWALWGQLGARPGLGIGCGWEGILGGQEGCAWGSSPIRCQDLDVMTIHQARQAVAHGCWELPRQTHTAQYDTVSLPLYTLKRLLATCPLARPRTAGCPILIKPTDPPVRLRTCRDRPGACQLHTLFRGWALGSRME